MLGRGVLLATVGTLLTAGLVGGLVLLVTDLPLLEALLLGAVVSSTDAAAVFSVLRAPQGPAARDVRSLLELESGTNDPMAVFLTVSLIALITTGGGSPLEPRRRPSCSRWASARCSATRSAGPWPG